MFFILVVECDTSVLDNDRAKNVNLIIRTGWWQRSAQ